MKKEILSILCVGAIFFGMANWAEATPIITEGLIAAYEFSGNANDSVGENHGTVHGSTLTADRFGNANSAYNFDGTDDWIGLEGMNFLDFAFNDFSISFWFQTSSSNLQGLIQGTDGSKWGLTGYNAVLRNSNDIETSYRAQYPDKTEMHSNLNIDGAWHNLTIIRDTANNSGYTYIDGVLTASSVDTNSGFAVSPQSFLRFGWLTYAPEGINRYLDGSMDDIYFYDRALSSAEITSLYTEVKPVPVPATILLFGTGIAVLVGSRIKRGKMCH